MSVKEIRELEDEVKEIVVDDAGEDSGEWVEKNVVDEDSDEGEDKEKEKFSIGDTMLARGSVKEVWGASGLEEELEGEEFDRGFNDDVFEEEEEFGEEGFSYETMGQSEGGDLYGVGGSGSGMDLYGAAGQKGSDSVNLYNTAGGSGGESELYNISAGKRKSKMSSVYNVEGPKKKKIMRNSEGSGLERGLNVPKKRRSKGVSMI